MRVFKLIRQTTFLLIVAVFLIIFLPGYAKIQELRQRNKELELNIKKLRKENLRFKKEGERLENDPAYLEKVARERLGVVKKGEVVYRFVPEGEAKK